jgi:molybdate transport system substrate-binding protein
MNKRNIMIPYSLYRRLLWHLVLCCGCASGAVAQQKITVAVAANMQYTIEAIKAEYQTTDAAEISIVVGSSGQLAQQILHGAPFDIFISADTSFPQRIAQASLAAMPPRVYAQGVLVLWSVKKDVVPKPDLTLLTDPGICHISIANPVTAPYGAAAEYILKKYNIYESVVGKLVTGESILQASQFIVTGAADIGFTAKSIVISDVMKGKGVWVELNRSDYPPIAQAAVLIKQATPNAAAAKFYAFLFSAKAKAIYQQFGYIVR